MQPCTGSSSRSIFYALRSLSLVFQPIEQHIATQPRRRLLLPVQILRSQSSQRQFSTSPTLQRSGSKRRDKAREEQAKKNAAVSHKTPSKGTRQGIVATRDFERVVESTLQDLDRKIDGAGGSYPEWSQFERRIMNACRADMTKSGARAGQLSGLKSTLQKAYLSGGRGALQDELEYMLSAEDLTAQYSAPNLEAQRQVADLRYPAEWYPRARSIQRTVHLHVGPTNSGKTYHALKRLEQCKSGFYAGPLRLLAQEVYHRFKGNGIPCSLVTGDEVKNPENGEIPRVVSNTVEMVKLSQEFDVGVIDEIQMIANPKRGWAWTRAVLGSHVSELHLCGEVRAVPLIRELCALTGDNLEIHRYERLNPLQVMPKSLKGNLNNLEKGDCLVAFSRVGIHALKADIEKTTGRRAAIVYGGLPAEIRTQQASLFNDPDNDYDFLVASDAIGMGLNLSCKRIIFETLVKRLPTGLQRLSVPEIKQIGGRAGRYRPASATGSTSDKSNIGYVTSLEEVDLPYIKEAMGTEPPPLRAAGIIPPDFVFQNMASYFPRGVPFDYLIKRLVEIAQVKRPFFMCDGESIFETSQIIDSVKGLRLQDKLTFMAAPMSARDPEEYDTFVAFLECVANHSRGRLLDIRQFNLAVLEKPVSADKEYMHDLENLHRAIIVYSWLSLRFGGVYTDRTLASHVKELVEQRMVRALTEFSANKKLRKDASLRRQIALQKQMQEKSRMGLDADSHDPNAEAEKMQEGSATENTADDSTEESSTTSDYDMMEEEDSGDSPESESVEGRSSEDLKSAMSQ